MRKIYCIIIISVLFLCSCSNSNENSTKEVTPTISTADTISSPKSSQENENTSSNIGLDLNKFISCEKLKIKSNLVSDKIEKDLKYQSNITGSYDLDSDKKQDEISIKLLGRVEDGESSIKINDKIFSFYANSLETYLVDLDKNDKYIEVVVLDNGASDDPNLLFFRYTGKEIIKLGNIHENVLLDGQGKALSTFQMTVFEPRIALNIYEVVNNKFDKKSQDYNSSLNKNYTVPNDKAGFFIEMNTISKDFSPTFTEEHAITLKKGDKIKIKNLSLIEDEIYWYEVELENGKKGVLYFWMGD